MPCNAYYFDSGICGLAFILNANLTCDVHDEHNKNVYLNGNCLNPVQVLKPSKSVGDLNWD